MVDGDRLRFDFTHFTALTPGGYPGSRNKVNKAILKTYMLLSIGQRHQEAQDKGILALLGKNMEKIVRVVEFGDYSKELCGGTYTINFRNRSI